MIRVVGWFILAAVGAALFTGTAITDDGSLSWWRAVAVWGIAGAAFGLILLAGWLIDGGER